MILQNICWGQSNSFHCLIMIQATLSHGLPPTSPLGYHGNPSSDYSIHGVSASLQISQQSNSRGCNTATMVRGILTWRGFQFFRCGINNITESDINFHIQRHCIYFCREPDSYTLIFSLFGNRPNFYLFSDRRMDGIRNAPTC